MLNKAVTFTILTLCVASHAWAHKPIIVGSPVTGPENPIIITDIDVSQVAYHEKTIESPEVWLSFKVDAGDMLFIQLGVPQLSRLSKLRPSMALVGPGLAPATLPFDIPAGNGALLFPTDHVENPELFNEPFTGTVSWQFPGHDLVLETEGTYYLVGYLPNDAQGKFWMVIGEREEFGLVDILSLPAVVLQVRNFHEVFPIGGLALLVPIFLLIFALIVLLFYIRA